MLGTNRQFLPPGNPRCRLGAGGRASLATKPLKLRCYFQVTRWPAACKGLIEQWADRAMGCSTHGLLDESERCPVPRVASEPNVSLPSLHNAGVRHRMAG